MDDKEFCIIGGHIIDPANGLNGLGSIGVSDGKIAAVKMDSPMTPDPVHAVRADGCIVIPGMIDMHVHAYEHVTPLGVNIDERCLARAVTTVVDAGSSGHSTFPGLRKFIAEPSQTRLLCFLHIASHGLASAGCSGGAAGGECDHLNQVDVDSCVDRIKNNRDLIVGVKVRLSLSCTDKGRIEEEVFRRALEAAERAEVPLMVHHTISTIPAHRVQGKMCCPLDMRNGDIYTHMLHPHPTHIVDLENRVILPDVRKAQEKGVLFDVGHGAGSFSWTVAEIARKEAFWPDVISSDLHSLSSDGPAYDLVTCMTKLHAIGMPLLDVIASVTSRPAAAIGRSDTIGSLSVGHEADITMLKIEDCDEMLEDCSGQVRRIKKKFVPVAVWRKGKRFDISPEPKYLAEESMRKGKEAWSTIEVRDKPGCKTLDWLIYM